MFATWLIYRVSSLCRCALWAPLCGRSEQCGLTWSSCILFLCISHTQLPWPLLGRPLCAFSTVCSCLVYCLFAWLNVLAVFSAAQFCYSFVSASCRGRCSLSAPLCVRFEWLSLALGISLAACSLFYLLQFFLMCVHFARPRAREYSYSLIVSRALAPILFRQLPWLLRCGRTFVCDVCVHSSSGLVRCFRDLKLAPPLFQLCSSHFHTHF